MTSAELLNTWHTHEGTSHHLLAGDLVAFLVLQLAHAQFSQLPWHSFWLHLSWYGHWSHVCFFVLVSFARLSWSHSAFESMLNSTTVLYRIRYVAHNQWDEPPGMEGSKWTYALSPSLSHMQKLERHAESAWHMVGNSCTGRQIDLQVAVARWHFLISTILTLKHEYYF